MIFKKCTECGKEKSLDHFNKAKLGKYGVEAKCRECKKSYRRHPDRISSNAYSGMRYRNLKRNHGELPFTFNEFKAWANSQDILQTLHKQWRESNYNRWLAPSFDRLDDSKGYSLDNLQIITNKQNTDKFISAIKNGSTTKLCKAVDQLTLNGTFIKRFHSVRCAEASTGVANPNIRAVCNGKYKQSNGFKWRWSEQPNEEDEYQILTEK